MMMCELFCYDVPAALKSQLDDHMGNQSDFETSFALLYALVAVPNIILPFFGGYLIDRVGVKTCLVGFSCLIVVGQIVFTAGFTWKSWSIMYIGRVIYGLGGRKYIYTHDIAHHYCSLICTVLYCLS